MADNKSRDGLIHQLFGEMPPVLRFVLMLVMIIPMALAMSGVILQLNVGKLIENAIDRAYDQQDSANERHFKRLELQISDFNTKLEAQIAIFRDTLATEKDRVGKLEDDVKRLKEWSCGHQQTVGPKEFTTDICR